ncbi:hypothetical protein DWG18_02030 [Lysobacter sp. TY2-98]|uniref:hypothetical protein n=1 Tax=Lysobacter sp. TY2-98 TaxID=2290922 RepID=UPI000E20C56B|nr:hypothetical protein [Lysobacter sp. TY2-98]AXK71182.1 hypothetical protein DWG18_02030 [Lysobacter sp. TY2-98]
MKAMVIAALALVASPAVHAAGPEAGRWSFTLFGGVDTPVSGDVHTGATVDVPDLGPLNPALAGVAAQLRIGSRSHARVYDMATVGGLSVARAVSDRLEWFGDIRQTRASRGRLQVGDAFVPALNTALPVYGGFSAYKATSIEGGARWYFMEAGAARPYVAARLGATRTDDIKATFEIPDAGITIPDAPFYSSNWAVSAGVDLGVSVPVSARGSFVAETGIRYVDSLDGDDSAIGPLGLASINDTGRRVSVPLTVALRWDF